MKKIHINAGHGGKDPGACGNGLQEKDIALTLAMLLGKALQEKGFAIEYTRKADIYIPVGTIGTMANAEKGDFFISLHCNAAANPQAEGIETLVYEDVGENHTIATGIQQALVAKTGWKDRGIKQRKDLAVLNSTHMTAVLVELGFITNEKEAKHLASKTFLAECSQAIAEAIGTYYGIEQESVPQWQKDGFTKLVQAGIIGDKGYWEGRLSETITIGEVVGLLAKL